MGEQETTAIGPAFGAAPGASLFSPAYEFIFALSAQLRAHGVNRKTAPITLVTPEPYAGHLGLGDRTAAPWIATRLRTLGVRVSCVCPHPSSPPPTLAHSARWV